jgi:Cu2+-containing amine oxidase
MPVRPPGPKWRRSFFLDNEDMALRRADPSTGVGWRILEAQKSMLVNIGVPVVDHLIEHVDLQADPGPVLHTASMNRFYRLTRNVLWDVRGSLAV